MSRTRVNRSIDLVLSLSFAVIVTATTLPASEAPASLRVRIINAGDGSGMPGVNVELSRPEGIRKSVISDLDGAAVLSNLNPGSDYRVLATFVGFSKGVIGDISLTAGSTLDLKVELHEFQPISLISLIADPRKHDGQYVQVVGFCILEFENKAIFLHEEDAKANLSQNSVWLSFPEGSLLHHKRFNRRYTLVEGVFIASNRGHMGLSSGAIERIERMSPW